MVIWVPMKHSSSETEPELKGCKASVLLPSSIFLRRSFINTHVTQGRRLEWQGMPSLLQGLTILT